MDAVIKRYEIVKIPLAASPIQLSDDLFFLTNGFIRASDVHGLAFLPKLVLHGAGTGVDVAEDISGILVIPMIAGRPPTPIELRQLIREMAMNNVSWGEERIANSCVERFHRIIRIGS